MRKYIFTYALGMACSVAHAQSSVTLSGQIDNALVFAHGVRDANGNTANSFSLKGGQYSSSVWGIAAVEDLGGGNQALANLLGSFDTNTGVAAFGEPNVLYNYTATIGLKSDTLGTIKLGRYYAIDNGVYDFDPFVQQVWSSGSLVFGRNWNTTINTINYWSPTWHGLDVYTQLGLGNQASFNSGTTGGYGRTDGVQLTYTTSVFQVRGIYDEMRDANGQYSNLYLYSREAIGMLNIFLGNAKISAAFTHMWADGAPAGAPSRGNHVWVGAKYQITPVIGVAAAVYHINANGQGTQGGGRGTMFEVGGTYNISKRTMIYATIGSLRNSSHAQFALTPSGVSTSDSPIAGHGQAGAYIGIDHTF